LRRFTAIYLFIAIADSPLCLFLDPVKMHTISEDV